MTRAQAVASSDLQLAGRCDSDGILHLYINGADRFWQLYCGSFRAEPIQHEWTGRDDWFPLMASSEVGEMLRYCTDVRNVGSATFEASREAFR
jgi:hypothetical protein